MNNKKYLFLISLLSLIIVSIILFNINNMNVSFNGIVLSQKATNSNEPAGRKVVNFKNPKLKEILLKKFKKGENKNGWLFYPEKYKFIGSEEVRNIKDERERGNKVTTILRNTIDALDFTYKKSEDENEIYEDEMEKIRILEFSDWGDKDKNNIVDFSDLVYAKNIEYLELRGQGIRDISFVKELKRLRFLYLGYNFITNVTPISKLENLEVIELNNNRIKDITSLKEINENNIRAFNVGSATLSIAPPFLDVNGNEITDFSNFKYIVEDSEISTEGQNINIEPETEWFDIPVLKWFNKTYVVSDERLERNSEGKYKIKDLNKGNIEIKVVLDGKEHGVWGEANEDYDWKITISPQKLIEKNKKETGNSEKEILSNEKEKEKIEENKKVLFENKDIDKVEEKNKNNLVKEEKRPLRLPNAGLKGNSIFLLVLISVILYSVVSFKKLKKQININRIVK